MTEHDSKQVPMSASRLEVRSAATIPGLRFRFGFGLVILSIWASDLYSFDLGFLTVNQSPSSAC
jgi:hypothetical protein